uniref:Ymf68 n=1 Tax=Tetrahymena paravorax TaxID=5905 RepID=Q09F51_TETPR|nr:Ymf68 [Tetrahymena paravorax]ABI51705.1 Ymf68 [Tetrahymena paravorax]
MYFFMDSKLTHMYWFDFNGTVNEKLPLTYETLKLCKKEIFNLKQSGNTQIGTKKNPIKLNLTFEQKHTKNENFIINSDIYETNSSNLFTQIKFNINSLIAIFTQPIVSLIEAKAKLTNHKLAINNFYLINGLLYIDFKDSFLKFNSLQSYYNDLNQLNSIKYNYIYRTNILNNNNLLSINTILDTLVIKLITYFYNVYLNLNTYNRFDYRLKQTDWGFYINNNIKNTNLNNLFSGLKFLWKGLRFWIVGLILGLSAIYYLLYVRLLPFNKILFSWILVAMFLYWLLSGFVFFVKKYQYSKFTVAIQRFWKRTYIIFWSIEGFTFLCFFYLTLNASAEPIYMYDQIRVYKTHLFSWRWFLLKLIPAVAIILLGYYLLLSLKWNTFNKQSSIIIAITLLLLYILWLEFYQFFHILSFFGNIFWSFDYEEYIWTLELDTRRTRLANNYIAVCLFLKFWHFVFIFLFWVFFVLRVNELGRARYPLLAANLQNFVIIYIMSWAYMYPWLKFLFRKYLDIPYYWFYLNGREIGLRVFFTDLKLFFYGLIDRFFCLNSISSIKFYQYPFFYWINSSNIIDYNQYRKFALRDLIITNLNSYIL